MFSILLVEDAPEYQTMVSKILGHHKIIVTDDPDMVNTLLEKNDIDLILLDISLPKRDGYSILHEIQGSSKFQHIPVICLTGKDQVSDKVTAFSLGADDFIQKPFNPIEFKARIDSKLAKNAKKKTLTNTLSVGNLIIDITSHRVYLSTNESEVVLTQTEFKILHHLSLHQGQVFSREHLLSSVWGDDGAVFDRAVDVHVCSLRKKLHNHGVEFKSVPGIGYKLLVSDVNKKIS
jgi:DNA-binding response OmpR family regulator